MEELKRLRDIMQWGIDSLGEYDRIEAKYRECLELYSVGLLTLAEAKDKLRG